MRAMNSISFIIFLIFLRLSMAYPDNWGGYHQPPLSPDGSSIPAHYEVPISHTGSSPSNIFRIAMGVLFSTAIVNVALFNYLKRNSGVNVIPGAAQPLPPVNSYIINIGTINVGTINGNTSTPAPAADQDAPTPAPAADPEAPTRAPAPAPAAAPDGSVASFWASMSTFAAGFACV